MFDETIKQFKKLERGLYNELFSNDGKLCVVRWLDNKPAHLLSTYLRSSPLLQVNWWSKIQKERIDVPCPQIVGEYNQNMGGVDLADMLLALYRIDRRSKKYYNRIVYYLFGVCRVNSWILYKFNIDENVTLLEFTLQVSLSLMRAGKSLQVNNNYSRRTVQEDIRYDGIRLIPFIVNDAPRQRRKAKECNNRTFIICKKCQVHLCIMNSKPIRNCFSDYHTKWELRII